MGVPSEDLSKRLLAGYDEEETDTGLNGLRRPARKSGQPRGLYSIICVLLVTNLLCLLQIYRDRNPNTQTRTKYANLQFDVPVAYRNTTEYQGGDNDAVNKLWSEIDTDPLTVTLTDEEAEEYGIETSLIRFPWDRSRGVYFVRAFHDLHCLKSLQKTLYDLYHHGQTGVAYGHALHCLDALRQDTLCNSEDTLMPVRHLPHSFGDGQVRMCRSYDQLVDWIKAPERSACYRRATDYGASTHWIEEYAFCPEGSPYYDLQQAYFAKWGHHRDGDGNAEEKETLDM